MTRVWSGAPAAHLFLDAHSLGITPDGDARFLVRALFTDKRGRAVTPIKGGNIDFIPSRGDAQWQTRLRFNAPSAVVSTTEEGPLEVDARASADLGGFSARVLIDGRSARSRRRVEGAVGAAVGPHLVQIGWFPRQTAGTVSVERTGPDGRRVVGLVGSPASTYRDATVVPSTRYRYTITRKGYAQARVTIDVPAELPSVSVKAVAGKGMWLTFSPDPRDDDGYTKLDPKAITDRAVEAGIHYIELRAAYGSYWEITPQTRPFVDALIDRAAERGVGITDRGRLLPATLASDGLACRVFHDTLRNARIDWRRPVEVEPDRHFCPYLLARIEYDPNSIRLGGGLPVVVQVEGELSRFSSRPLAGLVLPSG